jgi:hypothetical protein
MLVRLEQTTLQTTRQQRASRTEVDLEVDVISGGQKRH